MRRFGKRSFKSSKKLKSDICNYAFNYTVSLRGAYCKKCRLYSSVKPHCFSEFKRGLPFTEKVFGCPTNFTRRHCVQADVEDCNSHVSTIAL